MTDLASSRDWLFCPVTGALLDVDPDSGRMSSPASNFVRHLDDLADVTTEVNCNMESYRRRFNIEPLVKNVQEAEADPAQLEHTRATVDEACPKCGHQGLEYYTMQLRSADEGQTVFYECPKCKYKYSQNT